MTLPNKLTMVRILLIPVMIILFYIPCLRETIVFMNVSLLYLLEAIVFSLAAFTDFLDGSIARKRNLVTTFGKFADPLADKMLVFTAMSMFMLDRQFPLWAFMIILIRELMVSGIRMVAAGNNKVIAAGKTGKYKTAVSMVTLIIMFFTNIHQGVYITAQVLMYLSVILTVVSGFEYFWNSRKIILESI